MYNKVIFFLNPYLKTVFNLKQHFTTRFSQHSFLTAAALLLGHTRMGIIQTNILSVTYVILESGVPSIYHKCYNCSVHIFLPQLKLGTNSYLVSFGSGKEHFMRTRAARNAFDYILVTAVHARIFCLDSLQHLLRHTTILLVPSRSIFYYL